MRSEALIGIMHTLHKHGPGGVAAPRGPAQRRHPLSEFSLPPPAGEGNREIRECRSCYGCGTVVEDVELASGEVVAESMTCPICRGSGSVSVYLYPKRRSR